MTPPYKRKNTYWHRRNIYGKKSANAIHANESATQRLEWKLFGRPKKPPVTPDRPIKGKSPIQRESSWLGMCIAIFRLSPITLSSLRLFAEVTLTNRSPVLPNEVLELVFSHLSEDPTTALRSASRVCHHFRAVIKANPQFSPKVSRKTRNHQLYYAEARCPSLFPKHFLPCYKCNKIFDSRKYEYNFADGELRNGKGLGGVRAKSRTCLKCHHRARDSEAQRGIRFESRGWYRQPGVAGEETTQCLICFNPIIWASGLREDAHGFDLHADWQGELRREHIRVVKANQRWDTSRLRKAYCGPAGGLLQGSFCDLQPKKRYGLAKKQAQLIRRQDPAPTPNFEDILEDVSCDPSL